MKLRTQGFIVFLIQVIALFFFIGIFAFRSLNGASFKTDELFKGIATVGLLIFRIIRYFKDQAEFKNNDLISFFFESEDDYFIHQGRGQRLYRKGIRYLLYSKVNKAIPCFQEALKAADNFRDQSIIYQYMGFCYAQLEDTDNEIEAYDKSIELYPNNLRAYKDLGLTYMQMGEHDKAISCLKAALNKKPDDYVTLAYLGGVYVASEDYDTAIDILQKANNLSPGFIYTNNFLAMAYAGIGDRENAMAVVESMRKARIKRRQIKELQESIEEKLNSSEIE